MAKKNKPRHMAGKTTKQATRKTESPNTSVESAAQSTMPPTAAAESAPIQPLRAVTSVAQPRSGKGTQPSRTARVIRTAGQAIETNYDYVTSDIKRIGVLAVVMFAFMGILTFVLR